MFVLHSFPFVSCSPWPSLATHRHCSSRPALHHSEWRASSIVHPSHLETVPQAFRGGDCFSWSCSWCVDDGNAATRAGRNETILWARPCVQIWTGNADHFVCLVLHDTVVFLFLLSCLYLCNGPVSSCCFSLLPFAFSDCFYLSLFVVFFVALGVY